MTSIKVHSLRSRTVVLIIFPFGISTQRGARLLGSLLPVVQQPELHLHRPLLFTIFIREPPFPIPCSKTSTKPRIGAMTCMDRDHSASVPTIAAQTVFFATRPTCDGQTTLYPGPGQGRSECPRPGGCSSLTHHVHYLFFFLPGLLVG